MATLNTSSSSKKHHHNNPGTSLEESSLSNIYIVKENHLKQVLVHANDLMEKSLKYQSDSEILVLKKLEKNKSNLFLIKSYSFIDKRTTNRIKNDKNVKQNMSEYKKFHNLLVQEVENVKTKKQKQEKISAKPEKPKKSPKLRKMKKSKPTYESSHTLEQLLRTPPSTILNYESSNYKVKDSKRPQSLPASQNHMSVAKAKTLEDIETSHLKRDSFFRHSVQSIRRTLSSVKRNHQISSTSSSSNSSTSSSSVPKKKFKTKDHVRDTGNLKDAGESNYLIALAEEEDHVDGSIKANSDLIILNDNEILEQQQQHHLQLNAIDNNDVDNSSHLLSPVSIPTVDSFTVFKEEDEKKCKSMVKHHK